nr:flavodoxin-dependent (E)-4-hydroxy-3-methylbut-2-enyl-diphosphate synthase [Clostridia bacterium]
MKRRNTRQIMIGSVAVGSDAPVTVQSMTNTDTHDIPATLAQVRQLEAAGCDIVRLAVPDIEAASTFTALKDAGVKVPLVADIHFDYRIALECVKAGADKIRINPGNIGNRERVRAVAEACGNAGLPIRIGVNSGSVEKRLLEKYGGPTPEALCVSAYEQAMMLEEFGFKDILISIKASNVPSTVEANRMLAERCDYPLHIGITEAGTRHMGVIKAAAGIGSLLLDGIGDTLRVSLTDDPVHEVTEGIAILKAVGLRKDGIELVSCPTCGRTKIDLIALVDEFERKTASLKIGKPIKVALMGCVVNGPGEAREADIGIAGGRGEAVLIKHGEIVRKLPEDGIVDILISEIIQMTTE